MTPGISSKKRLSRFALSLVAVLAVLVGCVIWVMVRPEPAEPVYNGKPLSHWLKLLESNNGSNFPSNDLGSNAQPILLKAVEISNNPVKAAYRNLWPKLPAWMQKRWPQPVNAGVVRKNAAFILCRNVADDSLRIKLLRTHPRPEVRAAAADAFIFANAMYKDDATAALVEALNDKEPQVRRAATAAFCETMWYRQALAVVPTMLEKLGDSDAQVRTNAAADLTHLANNCAAEVAAAYNASPKEKEAMVRMLVKIVKANRLPEREAAADWLRIIDHEAAKKAGVK
jgi:HEAT repeat protein